MKKISILFIMLLLFFNIKAQFILEFDTNLSSGTTITIPLYGLVNVIVDWGDGTSNNITSEGDINHTYDTEGIYEVSIDGNLTHFGAFEYNNADKLFRVLDFGDIGITDLSYAFDRAINLIEIVGTIPTGVTTMSNMFSRASSFNQDLNNWDVSNVTDMSNMFYQAYAFNGNISSWDVDSVTNMRWMFRSASSFNQDISNWNVSKVTDMSSMFHWAYTFNQNISNWDVSNVTDMSFMFYSAKSFNHNISIWDVSKVNLMIRMFGDAIVFNQDIGNWNTANVINMWSMFRDALSFNQNLGNWNIEKVEDMSDIFYNVSLSTENYDKILTGWAAQNIKPNIAFNGGNSYYSCEIGLPGRNILEGSPNNWIITDNGLNSSIICIEDQTVFVDEDQTNYIINGAELDPSESENNCGLSSLLNDYNNDITLADAEFPIGTTTVTWTAIDNEGYTSICSFDIIIEQSINIRDVSHTEIEIRPNPTSAITIIEFSENSVQKLTVSDVTGKQIFLKTKISQRETIDLSKYESGIYICHIYIGKKIFTRKIIKI